MNHKSGIDSNTPAGIDPAVEWVEQPTALSFKKGIDKDNP
jgi:hypothetical protein